MDYKARTEFILINEKEEIYSESVNGSRLTKGEYVINYSGGLEGKGELVELKNYLPDGSITIVALERITGRLGEKSGSFVLEHHGNVKEGITSSRRHIVYGSGTGELAGVRGEIKLEWEQPKSFFILNYSLD